MGNASAPPSEGDVSQMLTAEVVATPFHAIPRACIDATQNLLIDHVGITYMGTAHISRELIAYAKDIGGQRMPFSSATERGSPPKSRPASTAISAARLIWRIPGPAATSGRWPWIRRWLSVSECTHRGAMSSPPWLLAMCSVDTILPDEPSRLVELRSTEWWLRRSLRACSATTKQRLRRR